MLPAADQSKNWEVINAGGISYASYRVAQLMEELIRYQPDLFIIYTGHNEFLEERTYHKIKEVPPLVRSTVSLLTHTRTWTAINSALEKLHFVSEQDDANRYKLSAEVDTILDQSAGPERYNRDDKLKLNILEHYRVSLQRMVSLARSVGAKVIFVKPASNLKDCSPFKSQHTPGMTAADQQRAERLEAMSQPFYWSQNWGMALNFLSQAVALDPRSADLQYRLGQTLLGMGRYQDAKIALQRARDEDVCPLRALTLIGRIVASVAANQRVPLVDFAGLLESRMQKTQGYSILGKEYFLDHVHPTIEGHKLLAVALLDAMTEQGLVHPDTNWGDAAIQRIATKIEGGVNQEEHGRALANLARVLLWAGKNDEAVRLAKQAIDVSGFSREVTVNAVSSIVTAYARDGRPELAVRELYSYLAKAPDAVELRLKLGQALLDRQSREEAAANFLLVIKQMPDYDWAHALFGIDMADRGRLQVAYTSLTEALRLNPNNSAAKQKLEEIRPLLANMNLTTQPFIIRLDRYPSMAPHRLIQGRLNAGGEFVPDGIEAEFYENGRIKRFVDFDQGVAKGSEITWDQNGRQLSSRVN